MSVLAERYRQLRPDLNLLADEAVLSQAWKKSDAYIKAQNWYADVLELDCTLIELPSRIGEWSRAVAKGDVRPSPMRLVPAPKNAPWHFSPEAGLDAGSWRFGCEKLAGPRVMEAQNNAPYEDRPGLRPLAHLSIRDQTLSTAVMLCLADAVETRQGGTDQPDYRTAQRRGVYSYGNRLFCDWSEQPDDVWRARFRWGNLITYAKYFQDYQLFLARPGEVCRDWAERLPSGRRLYVINLDLSKFYDCVNRRLLLGRLKEIYKRYAVSFDEEYTETGAHAFWERVKAIMDWSWDVQSENQSNLFGPTSLPRGLPQGLVASGFFANAYMLPVDEQIGQSIGTTIEGMRLLDYCRYVDDIRLVVSVAGHGLSSRREDNLRQQATRWINGLLEEYCSGRGDSGKLLVQDKKSEIVAWEDLALQGRTSQYMREVQSQISVTPDLDTLQQTTAGLDHLLWLADTLEHTRVETMNPLELSRIATPRIDVRDDTIKRFAANRLRKVLRLRRSMAAPSVPCEMGELVIPEVSEVRALDHEMETVARKLVACWARNPALVAVLRCGLDLFPSPDLLRPVLAALKLKLDAPRANMPNECEVAQFVLADLLKAATVETGNSEPEAYPEHADIEGYRREMRKLAVELLHRRDVPWFIHQQAAAYLASQNHALALPADSVLRRYRLLNQVLRYEPPSTLEELVPVALVAQQIAPAKERFSLWFGDVLRRLKPVEADALAAQLGLTEPDLLHAVVEAHPEYYSKWCRWTEHLLPPRAPVPIQKRLRNFGKEPVPLAALVRHPENPFVQENALLKLAEGLLSWFTESPAPQAAGLQSVLVQCSDWETIQDPSIKLKVSISKDTPAISEQLGKAPPWCRRGMEWAFVLGRLLRSAIIGEDDYTSRFYPLREEIGGYRGLRSSWYKRRLGLATLTQGVGEEPTPISPWLEELVLRLLQWPGLEIDRELVTSFSKVRQPADLLPVIKRRRRELGRLYGRLSRLPIYPIVTSCPSGTDFSRFRVAVVQNLLPRHEDICANDPTFWPAAFRSKHRRHLMAVCRLIHQHLIAQASAGDNGREPERAWLDLVVFPELSVHPDDLRILERLSDRTGGAVFAGMTFSQHPFLGKPINRAVWLVRQKSRSGRQIIPHYQGKYHPTEMEVKIGVVGHRPYQLLIEFRTAHGKPVRLAGVICYDATDLKLAADLRDVSDGLVITASNRDITTFDTMTEALQYHMFQPVVLANTGEYGGSNAQAPYREHHRRVIAQMHGKNQLGICVFELDLLAFKGRKEPIRPLERKTPPAGYMGR